TSIDVPDDEERRARGGESRGRLPVQADVLDELPELRFPRLVAARKIPVRRLGRTHPGQHLVVRERFDAVAAAKTLDVQFPAPAVYLEGKEILPFGAADVEKGGRIPRGSQQEKGVVVDRHLPEIRVSKSLDAREVAEEPARQVDQMDPLIDELATPGQVRIGPPLRFVPDSTAVSVPTAHEHEI